MHSGIVSVSGPIFTAMALPFPGQGNATKAEER